MTTSATVFVRRDPIGSGTPLSINVSASSLLPDCSIVNATRWLVYRASDATETPTFLPAVVSSPTTANYVSTYTLTATDLANLDTLSIYVQSSVNGGVTWQTSPDRIPLVILARRA